MITSLFIKLVLSVGGAVSSFFLANFTKRRLKKDSEREFEVRSIAGGRALGHFKADVSDRSEFEAKATQAVELARDKVESVSPEKG